MRESLSPLRAYRTARPLLQCSTSPQADKSAIDPLIAAAVALELRAVRGGGLVHRRLCHHHLSPSRPRPIRPSRQVPRRRELSLVIAHLHLSFPSPLVFSGP